MSKKVIACGCTEEGCNCHNEIEVFDYVPANTPMQCAECKLEHPVEEVESTGI